MQQQYHADFIEGQYYHVYNRTNNKEILFKHDANRLFFLKQYAKYLNPFAETFCWALLPNHFHFLIRIRSAEEIKAFLKTFHKKELKPVERKYLSGDTTAELLLESIWKRLFTSYAMAFNKENQRKGNLFYRPFKRIEVNKDEYFTKAVIYIHANAQYHNLVSDFKIYKWSSWQSLLTEKQSFLLRNELIEWFGGKQKFIDTHERLIEYYHTYPGFFEE